MIIISEMFFPRSDISTGGPAPDFEAPTLSGIKTSLSDFKNQKLILVFVSPRCGLCRTQIAGLEKQFTVNKFKGIKLIFVSDSSAVETKAMAIELNITLPILSAPRLNNRFLREYNRKGMYPYFVFINEQGTVESRGTVPSIEWQTLEASWK